jgi:hypothetical protein
VFEPLELADHLFDAGPEFIETIPEECSPGETVDCEVVRAAAELAESAGYPTDCDLIQAVCRDWGAGRHVKGSVG